MTDMDRKNHMDDGLQAFFDAAKATPEPTSLALMTRVARDGAAVQAGRVAVPGVAPGPVPGPGVAGLLSGLFRALGGWPALGGLATATVAGVWIGFSPNLGVGTAMGNVLGTAVAAEDAYLVDYRSGFEFAFEEAAMEGDAG